MSHNKLNQRRDFLRQIVSIGAIASVAPGLMSAIPSTENIKRKGEVFTFLFQGDSITDGNRTRNSDWNHVMGHGYQYIIAARLWYDFPGNGFHFFNRGISGNKVTDLAARWQKDTLELKPDLLSILIGINDIAAFINGSQDFTAEQYETDYRSLLHQTREQLPAIQFVLCEPFILPVGIVKENWAAYSFEIEKRREIVKRLSAEHNAVLVEFQKAFNKALSKAPAEYWIWDGIHPMPAGHELMAREWILQVSKKLRIIK
ncbi:MAG: SGNH/GDSL hydrolase family protein [Ferruginibacter sp.]